MKKIQKAKIKRIIGFSIAGAFASALLVSTLVVYLELQKLPKVDSYRLNTFGTSQITDKNGQVIWKETSKISKPLTYDEIPELYRDALIATEDKDFWTNHGFSTKALLGVFVGKARSLVDKGYVARGGSTLEQQLIKNTYYERGELTSTFTRKIGEWFLSKQLDENFSKEEVLSFYVNKLEFAESAIGVSAAMDVYFGKKPSDYSERTPENIAEQAYLAGLGQSPTTYNLYENPDGAKERTEVVLGIMESRGLISSDEREKASQVDLVSQLKERYHIQEELRQQNLRFKVYTDSVKAQVEALGYDTQKATLNIKTFLDPDLFQQIREKVLAMKFQDENQQIAVSVMNSEGIVVGMVGSRKENDELNRAIQQTRSSGSSMKPFTAYGALFEYLGGDKYNTATLMSTDNYQYPGSSAIMYNWGKYTYGQKSLQEALRLSLNTPVARIDDEILGSRRMKTFLHGLGLDTKDVYSSVDGIGLNISTLQASAAYNAINNKGIYTEPRFVDSITFVDGSEKKIEAVSYRAMRESTAFVLAQMLRGVPQTGYTAPAAKIAEYEGYGGKTGTVAFDDSVSPPKPYGSGGSDAWYDSITNGGYSVAIWTGYDEPNTSPQVADTYKEYTNLGKDLQLFLNGSRSVPNWTQPSTVSKISGSGVNAHYKVLDSEDLRSTGVEVEQLTELPTISAIKAEEIADKDFESKLGSWKSLYKLWASNPSIADSINVLDEKTYKALQEVQE